MQELKTRAQIEQPHIIIITEVNNKHVKVYPEAAVFNIPNFHMHTKNVSKSGKRGIIIYTHETLRSASELFSDIEFEEYLALVLLLGNNQKLLICGIYRSESGSDENNTKPE